MEQDFSFILNHGKNLALSSMRKLFDPQSWQPRDTPVFVVVSDPRTNGQNWVLVLLVISIFIFLFCGFIAVKKDTYLLLR